MNLRTRLYHTRASLVRRLKRITGGSAAALLYHRVTDYDNDPQKLCVKPGTFYDQLATLRKSHRFINIDEMSETLVRGNRLHPGSIVVTFDDGYADNLHQALPILESLSIPAVFFISTGQVGSRNLFWWDELDLACTGLKDDKERLNHVLAEQRVTDLQTLYSRTLLACKRSATVSERDGALKWARGQLQVNESELAKYRSMTSEEVRRLSHSSMATVGAHGVNHLSLAHVSDHDLQSEVNVSIGVVRELTGSSPLHFAFPYGEPQDFDQRTITICRNAGLKSAAANYPDDIRSGSERFAYPRLVVRDARPEEVQQQLNDLRR
jgi:peptidoglycan/xylan/chitin deacetylase (PgdA/CDA1 family)